eukprot:5763904-Pleurochrysis_carterae.AAC.1
MESLDGSAAEATKAKGAELEQMDAWVRCHNKFSDYTSRQIRVEITLRCICSSIILLKTPISLKMTCEIMREPCKNGGKSLWSTSSFSETVERGKSGAR